MTHVTAYTGSMPPFLSRFRNVHSKAAHPLRYRDSWIATQESKDLLLRGSVCEFSRRRHAEGTATLTGVTGSVALPYVAISR